MMKRLVGVLSLVGMFVLTMPTAARQPPGAPIEGFEPVESIPASEQLPAAPLLIAAYAFAWLVVFFYVWTVWRRLNKVENEMRVLEKRQAERSPQR